MTHLHYLEQLRLQRAVTRIYPLGERVIAEAFAEIGRRIEGMPVIFAVLAEYRRLTPEVIKAVGADRFPPRPLHVVPPT